MSKDLVLLLFGNYTYQKFENRGGVLQASPPKFLNQR